MNIEDYLSARMPVESVSDTEISIPCPECGKGGAHFQISLRRSVCHCFRCGWKGSHSLLVARIEKCSIRQAKEVLGSHELKIKRDHFVEQLPAVALPPDAGWTLRSRRYLKDRRLSGETIARFGLYHCGQGYYAGRIIIPIVFKGETVSFQARAVRDGGKRYLFPKGNPAGSIIYNYDGVGRGANLVVVEGPFDAMTVVQAGYAAVATFGKAVTERQVELIEELKPRSLTLLYDSDADIDGVYDRLQRKMDVQVGVLTEGDPADCEDIRKVLESTVSSPWEREIDFLDHYFQLGEKNV